MKRFILMLTVAALMVATMAVAGGTSFADPDCNQVPNNPNCVRVGPGESENAPGKGTDNNPNIKTDFQPKGQR